MIRPLFRLCLLLSLGLLSVSCHRPPQEAAYADLEWKDDVYRLAGQPFTGLARDAHKNGKPKGEYPFEEGRLHGVVREWWDNGQLSTETHFERGQRHGLNRYWTRKGNLMKEQVYDHDHSVSEKHYPVE
jgi:antitoxin component YwqK of YwqJK toxin-antitoxin module